MSRAGAGASRRAGASLGTAGAATLGRSVGDRSAPSSAGSMRPESALEGGKEGEPYRSADQERRIAGYISREREYRSRIELLEKELTRLRTPGPGEEEDIDGHRRKLRDLHTSIMGNIESVQDQTTRILKEQERDLLRAFRAKLFNVQADLERANAKASSGAAEWLERAKQLQKELEWSRETADRMDRHNQSLIRENERLRTQFKSQEDDREYLIRQLVAVKKDNARLRQDLAAGQEELEHERMRADELSKDLVARDMSLSKSASKAVDERSATGTRREGEESAVEIAPLRESVRRLRRALEQERRSLRQARQALAAEVTQRSEVESCFRKALAEVQAEVAKRKSTALSTDPRRDDVTEVDWIPVDHLGPADRREVLRRLVQQEEILRILRDSAFPPAATRLRPGGDRILRSTATSGDEWASSGRLPRAADRPVDRPRRTSDLIPPSSAPTKGFVLRGTKPARE